MPRRGAGAKGLVSSFALCSVILRAGHSVQGFISSSVEYILDRVVSPRLYLRLCGGGRSRDRTTAMIAPSRILVTRLDGIGDAALTLPLLSDLRVAWPNAVIDIVLGPGGASLLQDCTLVDRVYSWERPRGALQPLTSKLRAAGMARVLKPGYDVAVLPRWGSDWHGSRLIAVAAKSRRVVGFDPQGWSGAKGEGRERILLTEPVAVGDRSLHSRTQIQLLAKHLGIRPKEGRDAPPGMTLFTAQTADYAARIVETFSEGRLVLGVAVGAGAKNRQWPADHFVAFARSLLGRMDVAFIVLGDTMDRPRAELVSTSLEQGGIPVLNLAGRVSLSEAAAIIARIDGLVSGDSGLVHVASSLNVPTLVVSNHAVASSAESDHSPERFGPWSSQSRVVRPLRARPGCEVECRSREAHCICDVDPDDVALGTEELLRSQ